MSQVCMGCKKDIDVWTLGLYIIPYPKKIRANWVRVEGRTLVLCDRCKERMSHEGMGHGIEVR